MCYNKWNTLNDTRKYCKEVRFENYYSLKGIKQDYII